MDFFRDTSFDARLIWCSGKAYDDMLVAKLETVYTDSGDHGSSQVNEANNLYTNEIISLVLLVYIMF